jgi:hypothetical protein
LTKARKTNELPAGRAEMEYRIPHIPAVTHLALDEGQQTQNEYWMQDRV